MPTGGDGTAYMGEKMDLKKADMGDVIKDFYKSDAPQFKGRSKKKRRDMAIAAKLEAEGKSLKDEYLPEILDKKDIPHVKKLVGKLRSGSKTHAKQADDLEKAMKENTAIESELLIQDWNKDDIKFTEIETVDIIKAKPLKESMTDKEFMKTDVEMKNNAAAGVSVSQEKQDAYVKEVNRRINLKNQKKAVAGENKFKTKEMKKEHYDWKAELTEMGIKKINGDEEIIKPEGKTLKKGKERDGVFKLKKGVN